MSNGLDFLDQRGPTLELIRSIDWAKSPIGPQHGWPQSLKSALSICINSNFPIAIYWGKDLVLLYNEAWSSIPGTKHPWAFGKPAIEVWPDIWLAIEPQFKKAFTGIPGGSKDALLPMHRHGYVEERYFDFTFTPIYGESGKVEGIFNAVVETTYRVINERRAGVLSHLGKAVSGALTTADVFSRTKLALSGAMADVSFFFIYELVGGIATFVSSSFDISPKQSWPLQEVATSGLSKIIDNLGPYLPAFINEPWPEPAVEAIICPVKGDDGRVVAVIVMGASSRRRIDKDYLGFFDSISNLVSSELIKIQSLSKERERAQKTEKEFFSLFKQAPAHIHLFKGPEHLVEFFHPLGIQIIGRDITGQKIRDALPEVAGQGYFEMLDDVYRDGKTYSISQSRATLLSTDGKPTEHYFHITYLPWRDLNGNIQGVLQFSFDETEQVLATLRIKESEERFRVLSNSIPQFVWIADKEGNIEFLSDQWERYSGVSAQDGKSRFSSLIHADDIDEVRRRWQDSMATKQPWTAEFRLRDVRTGHYRWFLGHTVPLLDSNQSVTKWIGSSSDIQAQKTHSFELEGIVAERTSELIRLNNVLKGKNDELSRTQNFLRTVLDSSVELVMAFDTSLNFTFVNKRLTSISTRTPQEVVGKNVLEVDPSFDKTELYQQLLKALKGETIHIDARRPTVNPSLVFETFIIPIKENGEVTGIVTMQRDITNLINLTSQLRHSNEQLERSNEDLQQFAHVTSHDLKEPVRKIKTYGDILNKDFAKFMPEKGKDYLLRIDKAASRISSMIDGVLQYATVDANELELEKIDLNEIIKNVTEDLEIPIKEYGAIVDCGELPVMKGYPTLVNQLFYNLINNSLKFRSAERRPVIKVSIQLLSDLEEMDLSTDYFKILVEDNGIGFDSLYDEKIFDSFIRLHPKDRYEGTGLGLALCRKIVTRHHGVIKACGELNAGSRFSIYFPKDLLMS